MISREEITKNSMIPSVYEKDLNTLLERINKIRTLYGKPMTVTSGFRTWEDHVRIYKEKAQRRGVPFYITQVPNKSKHLYCQAVDVSDPHQELQKWILNNVKILEDVGLWCEDFSVTKNWVHFQILPPASNKRFFMP